MKQKSEIKTQRILQAALDEFLAMGYRDAKIEDIAKRAKVGKGTVYQYFPSKDVLFESMIYQGMANYSKALSEAVLQVVTLEQMVANIVNMHLEFIHAHQQLAYMFYASDIQLSENIKGSFEQCQQGVIETLGACLKNLTLNGSLQEHTDYKLLMSVLFGTMNQYYAPHMDQGDPVKSPEEFIVLMCELLKVIKEK